jgi:hypothetical protein
MCLRVGRVHVSGVNASGRLLTSSLIGAPVRLPMYSACMLACSSHEVKSRCRRQTGDPLTDRRTCTTRQRAANFSSSPRFSSSCRTPPHTHHHHHHHHHHQTQEKQVMYLNDRTGLECRDRTRNSQGRGVQGSGYRARSRILAGSLLSTPPPTPPNPREASYALVAALIGP